MYNKPTSLGIKKILILLLIPLAFTSCGKPKKEPVKTEVDGISIIQINNSNEDKELAEARKAKRDALIAKLKAKQAAQKKAQTNTRSQTNSQETQLKDTRDTKEIERELFESATNIEDCEALTIYKAECRDKFYYETGVRNNSIKVCEQVKNQTKKTNCKNNVYFSLAKQNNSKSYCDKITDPNTKEQCYNAIKTIAEDKKQALTETEIFKKVKETKNAELCKGISYFYDKLDCITPIIMEKMNINLCKTTFDTEKLQNICFERTTSRYNTHITSKALETGDKSLCQKSYGKEAIESCIAY